MRNNLHPARGRIHKPSNMLARGRRKQSTPRKGTNTYRSMWRQILHAGNNLPPARGRIPCSVRADPAMEMKQSTPRKGTNTFTTSQFRLEFKETIYTPQGDEYPSSSIWHSRSMETIYTPQGDEYSRPMTLRTGIFASKQSTPRKGTNTTRWSGSCTERQETIYTPQGDEYLAR